MGFEIQRFVDKNIDPDFMCNICQDVLEEPLMIAKCQHFYCSQCIRDCIRLHGVCPEDRSPVALKNLVEPIRFVKNQLNKLKVKCASSSGGCKEVFPLGELQTHWDTKCTQNPENKKTKCFCKQEFPLEEFIAHKDKCLDFQKNELKIARIQLSTYSAHLYDFNRQIAAQLTTNSEITFLFSYLKQKLPKEAEDYNDIQKTLLYIQWKLLVYETETEKDILSAVRYVKFGFEDLVVATGHHYWNLMDFIGHRGMDYMYLCESVFNNKHINRYIGRILRSLSEFEDLMTELMNRKCIKMLNRLMNVETNELNTCIDCAIVLTAITLTGPDEWDRRIPDLKRQTMLNNFKTQVFHWKFSHKSDISYQNLKQVFSTLESNETTPEVNRFYVWLLAYLIRSDDEKYIPMIITENRLELLKGFLENEDSEYDLKSITELVLNDCIRWQKANANR